LDILTDGACLTLAGMEVDDDVGWLTHSLHFPKDNNEEVNKAEREYEVIDPRARASKAREDERHRKAQQPSNSRQGGGGIYRPRRKHS
jgi:peptidyl-prolyl cis-trans isomerase SDCCAG10